MATGKTIKFSQVCLIGAITALVVGALDFVMGDAGRHQIAGDMWWCFFGAINVWLCAEPSTLFSLWRH